MLKSKGFIFTNKEHTKAGIMSTILGILASVTLGIAVYQSYLNGGGTSERHTAAALLAVVFMVVGMGLGVWSTIEKEKYKLFTVLGIFANTLAFGMLSLILYAGAYAE